MMRRIFWVLVFCFLILPAWAGNIDEEEIILFDPNDNHERFINIKKNPSVNFNDIESKNTINENQSFKINQNINNKNKFKMKLDYDDSNLYSSKYKRVDELSAETKGQINKDYDYRVNIIGNNLYSDDHSQRVYTNSYIGRKLNNTHKIYLGGSRLSETTKSKIGFLNDIESTYGKNDMGGKLQGKLEKFDYSLGAYKDLGEEHSYSSGAVAAFKPLGEKSKVGKWSIGSAYYSKNQTEELNKTVGAFSHYKNNRFGLKNEYARNYYGADDGYNSNWSFAPEYYITKNLALKTKHKQWQQSEGYINDFILEYSLKNHRLLKINNLKLQLKASYIKGFDEEASRRVGFTSKFSF